MKKVRQFEFDYRQKNPVWTQSGPDSSLNSVNAPTDPQSGSEVMELLKAKSPDT